MQLLRLCYSTKYVHLKLLDLKRNLNKCACVCVRVCNLTNTERVCTRHVIRRMHRVVSTENRFDIPRYDDTHGPLPTVMTLVPPTPSSLTFRYAVSSLTALRWNHYKIRRLVCPRRRGRRLKIRRTVKRLTGCTCTSI